MRLTSIAWVLAALMCGAAIAGVAGKPTAKIPPIDLDRTVPHAFEDWTEVREAGQVVDRLTTLILSEGLLTRTYVNRDGYRIMLLLISQPKV